MQMLRSSFLRPLQSITKLSVFLFAVAGLAFVPSAFAQDPGVQAAMQAQQAAMQAQMNAQQAASAAAQANQQATMNTPNTTPVPVFTLPPAFSVHGGKVAAGTTVRLTTRTHYATIYYTTNGWAPTEHSHRYTGPITLTHTTQIQAIAVAPNSGTSLISVASFTVPGTQAHVDPTPLSIDGLLHAGTHLHLVTVGSVTSKTAQVGDELKLALNQDVKIGDSVILAKGTPVLAKITQADHAGHAGVPGDLSFEVQPLTLDGKQIPLTGGETLEGRNHYARNGFALIPVVGVTALAFHGDEAEIVPGMRLTAEVAADTPMQPSTPGDQ